MKILKTGVILVLFIFGFNSCKKEDSKIENIDIKIEPYQWTWNNSDKRWEYSVSHSYIQTGVLMGYVMASGKELMPYYDAQIGVTYSIVDFTFQNQILITYYDGTNSLAQPAYAKNVYLKIIPSP